MWRYEQQYASLDALVPLIIAHCHDSLCHINHHRYTFRKWLETVLKGLLYDRRQISCVEPRLYAHRFVRFIDAVSE